MAKKEKDIEEKKVVSKIKPNPPLHELNALAKKSAAKRAKKGL